MRLHPFGLLVTYGEGGLLVEHLALILDGNEIIGHVNAKNPVVERFQGEGLLVFSGPHAYISPRWYPSGFNIPTWNYQAVHVKGPLRRLSPEENLAGLKRLVGSYEDLEQPQFNGMFESDSVFKIAQGTVGFAITIHEVQGQFKLSQNKKEEDFLGALNGLRQTGRDEDSVVALAMESVWSS